MSRLISFLVLFVLVLGSVAQAQDAQKIGAVDVKRVFDGYAKKADLEKEMSTNFDAEFKKMNEWRKRIQETETSLVSGGLDRNSVAFVEAKMQLDLEKVKIKKAVEALTVRASEYDVKKTREIYLEIRAAVKAFGEKNNYSMIIKSQPADLHANTMRALQKQISSESLLYTGAPVDITDKIIQFLNTLYSRGIKLVSAEELAKYETKAKAAE